MEKVIKESLQTQKDIEKIKVKIFSKTLNENHNLKLKIFYILQSQPYVSEKKTKEKLNLKEECLTTKIIENIDSYYDIKQSKENLLNILNDKEDRIYPNYITFEQYVFEKMSKYISEKRIIDYNLSIINKIRREKEKNRKTKKYYYYQEQNNEFANTMFGEGVKTFYRKTSKNQSIRKKKKEKKTIILLKADKFKNNNKFQEIIEKRENNLLIKELKQSVNKINKYNYHQKLKSTNILYEIFNKLINKVKLKAFRKFITKLIFIKKLYYLRNKSSAEKTMIIPVLQKRINKAKSNRHSLVDRKSIIMKLFQKFSIDKKIYKEKYKFKPVYLFNKNYNEENKLFNDFFQDWNNNKNKQMINNIYKYTEENFNNKNHLRFSQINKLIINNKLDTLTKEVSKNKSNTKRFNTFSNTSLENKNKFSKSKRYNKNIYDKKDKLLLNLKYQL